MLVLCTCRIESLVSIPLWGHVLVMGGRERERGRRVGGGGGGGGKRGRRRLHVAVDFLQLAPGGLGENLDAIATATATPATPATTTASTTAAT